LLHFNNRLIKTGNTALKSSISKTDKTYVLENGCEILVREIEYEDRRHFLNGIRSLSKESLYHRFNSTTFSLTKKYLDYFTDIDSENHCAAGAIDLSKPDEPGIAVGRFIRLKKEPEVAELAITVLDEYQRLGIGTILFLELCRIGQSKNVQHFTFTIHAQRRVLVHYMLQHGAVFKNRSGSQIELSFPLSSAADYL
jgi:GNAT superfamily N-acetyltransferase